MTRSLKAGFSVTTAGSILISTTCWVFGSMVGCVYSTRGGLLKNKKYVAMPKNVMNIPAMANGNQLIFCLVLISIAIRIYLNVTAPDCAGALDRADRVAGGSWSD